MSVRQFLDLTATVVLAVVGALAVVAVGPSPVSLVLALPLLLLLPGYAVVSALFPDNGPESVGNTARLGLSVALSVAITPALAFASNYTIGIYPRPIVVGIAVITVSLCFIAAGRRADLEPSTRAGPEPFLRAGNIYERYFCESRSLRSTVPLEATSGRDVFLNLLVVGAVLVFAASVGFAAIVPHDDGVTETYLATTNGDSVSLVQNPGGLSGAERESLVAVVQNEEGESTTYTVVVAGQDVTRNDDGVTVDDQQVVKKETGSLDDGDTWHVGVPTTGGDRTVVMVYHGQARGEPDYQLVLQN